MNEKFDPRKKKKPAETPVHVIREGTVAALIWLRQSPAGFAYHDFSLTRSWKSLSSGSIAHSKNFFSRNQSELSAVIGKACAWISAHEGRVEATTGSAA